MECKTYRGSVCMPRLQHTIGSYSVIIPRIADFPSKTKTDLSSALWTQNLKPCLDNMKIYQRYTYMYENWYMLAHLAFCPHHQAQLGWRSQPHLGAYLRSACLNHNHLHSRKIALCFLHRDRQVWIYSVIICGPQVSTWGLSQNQR